jgi:hypothetical protein
VRVLCARAQSRGGTLDYSKWDKWTEGQRRVRVHAGGAHVLAPCARAAQRVFRVP